MPRIASIQASGANPFFQSYMSGFSHRQRVQAQTVATAIKIGDPVSYSRARKVIEETNGVVEEVTDEEILAAKTVIDRSGIGCEPASAATLAGIRKLVGQGIIKREERVVHGAGECDRLDLQRVQGKDHGPGRRRPDVGH